MSEPETLDVALLRRFPLPHHAEDGDKEERGVAQFIAGSRELSGAAQLAGIAALRAGAGKLRVATSESIALGLGIALPEARIMAFAEDKDGCIAPGSIARLVEQCGDVDSLTIGPGMQAGAPLTDLIAAVLDDGGAYPLVLDAAALGLLPPLAAKLRAWTGGAVLLPHAGEMARLLECERETVAADPLAAARKAAEAFGAVAVVKGQWSFVVAPDGRSFRFLGGGIGLATSGSGDTLAGIVGGLAARGADPLTAALWGVYLHGEAGRTLTRDVGRVGFLAREIPDLVPGLMQAV
ncbi:NAD(P)H-hydrate dehydratase [Sphingomonas sp. LY54]|uniref:NAD(P)H-hydrate dehydratase n=1 Tax=Sphingomonas sp. LY54 TaxID=3095343 RepID=UPI002D78D8E1|nr:NAD(P)H-hydrate dehydratase [Sphingomonas sp. LY54]WRP27675.1 NAD(P)H-hydrate dehydratase [Sphingomonas sp. LY54]